VVATSHAGGVMMCSGRSSWQCSGREYLSSQAQFSGLFRAGGRSRLKLRLARSTARHQICMCLTSSPVRSSPQWASRLAQTAAFGGPRRRFRRSRFVAEPEWAMCCVLRSSCMPGWLLSYSPRNLALRHPFPTYQRGCQDDQGLWAEF
jgi:hypothetical protein